MPERHRATNGTADFVSTLRWLIALRVLVVLTIGATYALATLQTGAAATTLPYAPVRQLVAGGSILTLLYIGLLRVLGPRYATLQAYVQFVGDVLLTTLFIVLLGDAGRPFSLLYLVVISVAALLLRRSAGLIVAGLSFVGFGCSLFMRPSPVEMPVVERLLATRPEQLYELTVHLIGFYAIALLTSYLARDVTRAERALAERDQDLARLQVLYRDVIRSISSGLITTDLDGQVTSANQAAEQILDRPAHRLVGRPITATGMFTATSWEAASWGERDSGSSGIRHMRSELDIARGDTIVPVGYSLALLRDSDGADRGFILIFQDLTELRKLQEQVRLQDRMAAIGELAAGLAHEVGNPLAAISGATQMLASSFQGDPSRRKLLEITLRESQRLDRTVKGFLAFARPPEMRTVRFDVAALLAEQIELLKRSEEVREGHRIETDLVPPSVALVGDPDQISQVFWNLVRNGLKAMPDGGILTLGGRIDAARYRIHVTDTGKGMTEDERTKLFQPFKSFFDEGVGIGMAIVYRIVEEHGGRVEVDSVPGAGTTIAISLPLQRQAAATPLREEMTS